METNELDRIIDWCRIPIVKVIFTVECKGCELEIKEEDAYGDYCSFSCYCQDRCI